MSGSIKINGTTSGSTTITAPATGGDESIELSTALASKLDLAGGKILQIVRATDSTNRLTTSTSYADVTGMSVTITPIYNTSAVLLIAACQTRADRVGSNTGGYIRITDSSDNAISGTQQATSQNAFASTVEPLIDAYMTIIGYATPATTSSVTYKLRFRVASGGNFTVQNAVCTGQMFAIEVSA